MGVKCSQEVATAICRALLLARLFVVPVQWGSWGSKVRKPHAVPCKVTRHCGSVLVCLIPAPRGTGIISAPVPKKLLMTVTPLPGAAPPPWHFRQGYFWCHFQDLQLSHPWSLERVSVHWVFVWASVSGIHWSSCKDPLQSFRAKDPGSSCSHQFYVRKK